MQDRYTGDVGDFGKYGMLRALCAADSEPALALGVVWYLFPDESHNEDGKHVAYLADSETNHHRFRACDPELWDALASLVGRGDRRVEAVERAGLLPAGTRFAREALAFDGLRGAGARAEHRRAWLERARAAVESRHLVFLDPDNGLEPLAGSTRATGTKGPKFAFLDELEALASPDRSLVVYHHLDRSAPAAAQLARRFEQLSALEGFDARFALRFRRGTARAFFVLAREAHTARLGRRAEALCAGKWGENGHFELVRA